MDNKKVVINIDTEVNSKPLDDIKKSIDELKVSAAKTTEGMKNMAEGIKKIGSGLNNILKATGIIYLLVKLRDVFMSNQAVADKLATAMTTISIVFNEVAEVVTKVVERVAATTNNFEGLTNVLKGSVLIVLNYLKVVFYEIKLAIQEAQLGWEKSFFGDKDQSKIKELTASIDETRASIIKAGESAVENGKLVVNNLGKAINEIAQVVEGSIDGISKIDIKAAQAQANALVQLEKRAKRSEVITEGLNNKYEVQGEKLKQIRDNEEVSISDRIKANNELKEVLEKQGAASRAKLVLDLELAKAKDKVNHTDETSNDILKTQNSLKDGNAQLEAKLTEQTVQGVSLRKQELELINAIISGNQQRFTKELDAKIALIKIDKDRLAIQLSNLELLKTTELQILKDNIDKYEKGTQAKIDAENAYKDKKLDIDNQIIAKQNEIFDKNKELTYKNIQGKDDAKIAEIENEQKKNEILSGITSKYIQKEKQALINKELDDRQKLLDNVNLTQGEKEKIITESEGRIYDIKNNAFRKEMDLIQKRLQLVSNAEQAAQGLSDAVYSYKLNNVKKGSEQEKKILKEQFETNKKLQVAQAVISGLQAIQSIWAAPAILPQPFDAIAKGILTAASVATSAANVAKISSTKFDSGGSGGSSPSSNTSTPNIGSSGINNVGGIGTNTYNPTLQNQTLQYETVKVVEIGDINRVQNKVSVLESRATIK